MTVRNSSTFQPHLF